MVHILWIGVVTHQAYTPNLAGQGSQTTANFDAVLVQQVLAEGLAIHALWNSNCREGGEPCLLYTSPSPRDS